MRPIRPLSLLILMLSILPAAANAADLDISQYQETFSETFREPLDVTPWGPSRWIAHTPWNGDFGDARFSDPRGDFPFSTGPNGLTITARKNAMGKWEAGLLSSTDRADHGFSQAYGYFEAKMKLPPGPGVWPAFWLVANGDPDNKAEIDVLEYYGHAPAQYTYSLHLWPKDKTKKPETQYDFAHVPPNSLTTGFHTYGVDISDDAVVFYLDRHELGRMPTPPAAKYPMTVLINLALGSGWPIDKTPDPSVLQVDYVKVYAKKP
jgi:beta-glucanase (GH16 family)